MTQPASAGDITFDRIYADLSKIVEAILESGAEGKAPYPTVHSDLQDLGMHLLTYVRFLENHGYLDYDRVQDVLVLSAKGVEARHNPGLWHSEAEEAFAENVAGTGEHQAWEATSFDDFSMDDVDEVLDSFAEIEASAIAPLDEDQGDNTLMDDTPEPLQTKPEISKPTGNEMTQNTFGQRRFQTSSSQPAVSAGSGGANLYERIEEIGNGGIGTVFRGQQIKLARDVAIKEVREIFDVFAGVQRSDIVERFTKIVQTQSQLTHPNIVGIIDLDTDAEYPFVVMQYAPNGNLRRLIDAEGRPPLQVALKYFLQILHALNTAHDADVAHGGIKPENVVLDQAGNAMLTDFGISQVVEHDSKRANQVYVGVGTVAYMSPEQFRDPNAASIRSDIYSLGIMFYEMLTGKVPGRRSPMPSSFYPDIPRKLDDVFDRMSMDEPDDRYESVDEILADIYGAEEVMKILDNRGGFLFLRDPITHGEIGLKVEIAPSGHVDSEDDGEGLGLSESSSEDSDADLQEESEDSDALADEDSKDGDVLDKLDKYGELFEGDDDEGDD